MKANGTDATPFNGSPGNYKGGSGGGAGGSIYLETSNQVSLTNIQATGGSGSDGYINSSGSYGLSTPTTQKGGDGGAGAIKNQLAISSGSSLKLSANTGTISSDGVLTLHDNEYATFDQTVSGIGSGEGSWGDGDFEFSLDIRGASGSLYIGDIGNRGTGPDAYGVLFSRHLSGVFPYWSPGAYLWNDGSIMFRMRAEGPLQIAVGPQFGTPAPVANWSDWNNLRFVRSNNKLQLFVNSAEVASTVTFNDADIVTDDGASGGEWVDNLLYMGGYPDVGSISSYTGQSLNADIKNLYISGVNEPSTGILTGTPTSDDVGDHLVTLNAIDPYGLTTTQEFTITVDSANSAPLAVADSLTVDEGGTATTLTGGATSVLTNDTDVEADLLTAALVTNASHGTLLLNSDGTFTYTHDGSETTSDSFTYKANDGLLDSAPVTVAITVTPTNDSPGGTVTITGTAEEDQILTVSNTLSDEDGLGGVGYQWKRDGNNISGATASSYMLVQTDVGELITVTASYTDGQGASEAVTSAATGAVVNVNDAPSGTVMISGAATEDEVLTASNDLLDEDGLGEFGYQWKRGGTAIDGAMSSSYTLTQGDVGEAITVTVSYTDAEGTAESVTSVVTASVVNVNDAPTGVVTISGTTTEDQVLTASHALADEDGLGPVSYVWKRDGRPISFFIEFANKRAHATQLGEFGGGLSNGTFQYGNTYNTWEDAVNAMDAGTFGILGNLSDSSYNVVPVGKFRHLQASDSTLFFDENTGLLRSDANNYLISQTGLVVFLKDLTPKTTYTLGQTDVGELITVTASYTDGQGTSEAVTSAATGAVVNVNDVPSGTVVIVGEAKEDEVLTASNDLLDEDGLGEFGYQWKRGGDSISGATASSYTLVQSDVGELITVTASYTDGQGTSEAVTSAATGAVENVNDIPIASNQIASVNEDDKILITLSGIDEDPDDVLTASIVSLPKHGTVILFGTTAIYTPESNFHSSDSFAFKFNDKTVDSNTALVNITVNPVNDLPVPSDQSLNIDEDTKVVINLTAMDLDGDSLAFTIVDIPLNGTLSGTGNLYEYMPDSEFSGSDSFTFKVFDSSAESRLATVSIYVNDTKETQRISLKEGWNLVSLYTKPHNMKPSSIFSGHFDVIEEIRTLKGVFNTSWPEFINTIKQLDLTRSYWIKANVARSDITVTGQPLASTEISLAKGWNLIGYPSIGAQETAAVFKSLSDNNAIDRIIGTSDFYSFDPNAIYNSLSSLKPGDGYWVKMHSAATFTVNSVPANDGQNGGRRLAKAGGNNKYVELKQSLVAYPSVPAICVVEIRADGRLAEAGSLLAAYVGDELRGVQKIRHQDGKMIVPVVIQSTQPAEVRFRLWHAGLAKWFEVAERIEADSGDALGMDGNGPVVLNVTAPWPSAPGLALRQQPLRLLVRHESDRKFVVEQSRNLKEWVVRWQLTGTDEWRELLIPLGGTRGYFRVRALD